jgi:hypothetical protein
VRLFASDRIRIPDMQSDMLHELYLLDWPYFDECPVQTLWAPTAERMRAKDADSTSVAAAEELALTIKDLARAGREEVPPSLLKRASQSPLAQYTAVRLLWDPYTDATRLIRQFRERNER